MGKVKFDCDKCGNITHVTFDGYHIGERLLEGVIFHAHIKKDKIEMSADKDSTGYFSSFDQKKWLKEALIFVTNTDIVQCGICGQDAAVIQETEKKGPAPVSVKIQNAKNFIDLLGGKK